MWGEVKGLFVKSRAGRMGLHVVGRVSYAGREAESFSSSVCFSQFWGVRDESSFSRVRDLLVYSCSPTRSTP
jgi:hypothetical protein